MYGVLVAVWVPGVGSDYVVVVCSVFSFFFFEYVVGCVWTEDVEVASAASCFYGECV